MSENEKKEEEEIKYEILDEDVTDVNYSFKIIVIGDSNVGKSCLTLKGTKNKFKDFYSPTIGFEFLSFNIKINDKIVKLQIWDTCGQEVYRSLISSFYRNSSLAIIVYAINNKESFDNLESWLDEIKSKTHPYLKIFLIGNKVDLENERVVDRATAEELAKDHNIDLFLETSAKTGVNAKKLFVKAAQILLENYKDFAEFDTRDSNASKDKSSITLSADENDNGNIKDGETGPDIDKKRKKKCGC
jgi:small GTP-binding protein